MPLILDSFKVQPFDLQPVFASWPAPHPIFYGNPSKDPPVDEWLKTIKAGCIERKVPKEYWHKVGQHFLGERAKGRLAELKAVLVRMHGGEGKYRWNWKKFKVAMRNLGWEIEDTKTQEVKVQSKPSGLWWIVGGRSEKEPDDWDKVESKSSIANAQAKDAKDGVSAVNNQQPPPPSTPFSKFRRNSSRSNSVSEQAPPVPEKPTPKRSSSLISEITSFASNETSPGIASSQKKGWLSRNPSASSTITSTQIVEEPKSIEGTIWNWKSSPQSTPQGSPSNSVVASPAQTPGEVITSTTQAPLWLLNATNALDFLTSEHPKTMSALSAILITVGSLPAIPALHATAAGAILANHAVQAAGAVAVGVGKWLKAEQTARSGSLGSVTEAKVEEDGMGGKLMTIMHK